MAKIKGREIMDIQDITPSTLPDVVVSNGVKTCPICGMRFLYGRSTKKTCGEYKCVRLNRKKRGVTEKEREVWVQIRLILDELRG